jgi:MOSC domain-containing protein YiiM
LCIWSTDAIDTLRAEGHPIAPGYAGENLTISGIPAASFRPGAHFRVGTVRGFLTAYAIPCSQNNDWFVKKDFKRMSHERGDESRLYAMITTTGTISAGDAFELFTDR